MTPPNDAQLSDTEFLEEALRLRERQYVALAELGRHVLHEYIQHYNARRPHRTLALDSPDRREPQPKPTSTATAESHPVLGGLHHQYEWAA